MLCIFLENLLADGRVEIASIEFRIHRLYNHEGNESKGKHTSPRFSIQQKIEIFLRAKS